MAGVSAQPYIVADLISAVPASIGSIAAWKNAHQGRKENNSDHAKVQAHLEKLDTGLEKLDISIARMDLRFDSIDDKVERHLGWHRNEAATTESLAEALSKEYTGDYPTYQSKPDPER